MFGINSDNMKISRKKLETFLSRKDRLVTSEVKDKVKQIASDGVIALWKLEKEYNPFTDVVVDSILQQKSNVHVYFPITGEHQFSS